MGMCDADADAGAEGEGAAGGQPQRRQQRREEEEAQPVASGDVAVAQAGTADGEAGEAGGTPQHGTPQLSHAEAHPGAGGAVAQHAAGGVPEADAGGTAPAGAPRAPTSAASCAAGGGEQQAEPPPPGGTERPRAEEHAQVVAHAPAAAATASPPPPAATAATAAASPPPPAANAASEPPATASASQVHSALASEPPRPRELEPRRSRDAPSEGGGSGSGGDDEQPMWYLSRREPVVPMSHKMAQHLTRVAKERMRLDAAAKRGSIAEMPEAAAKAYAAGDAKAEADDESAEVQPKQSDPGVAARRANQRGARRSSVATMTAKAAAAAAAAAEGAGSKEKSKRLWKGWTGGLGVIKYTSRMMNTIKRKRWLVRGLALAPEERSMQAVRDLVLFSKNLRFFQQLPLTVCEHLCRVAVSRKFEVGEVVCRQGEEGRTFYIVVSGKCSVHHEPQDDARSVASDVGSDVGSTSPINPRIGLRRSSLSGLVSTHDGAGSALSPSPSSESLGIGSSPILVGGSGGSFTGKGPVGLMDGGSALSPTRRGSMSFKKEDLRDAFEREHGRCLAWMQGGMSFGEMALIQSEPRNATVVCREACELMCVDRDDYNKTLRSIMSTMYMPDSSKAVLQKQPGTRLSDEISMVTGVLSEHLFFKRLERVMIKRLVGTLRLVEYPAKQVLFEEGQAGSRFLIISKGSISVHVKPKASGSWGGANQGPAMAEGDEAGFPMSEQDADIEERFGACVTVLNSGDSIGEKALLQGARRNATCITREPCSVLIMDKAGFREMIDSLGSTGIIFHPRELRQLLCKPPGMRIAQDVENMIEFTSGLSFFRTLNDELLEEVFKVARFVRCKGNQIIYAQGASPRMFYVVLSGKLCVRCLDEQALGDARSSSDDAGYGDSLMDLGDLGANLRSMEVLSGAGGSGSSGAGREDVPGDSVKASTHDLSSAPFDPCRDASRGFHGPVLRTLTAGQTFGELELMELSPRQTTVVSEGACEFMVLHSSDYAAIIRASHVSEMSEKIKYLRRLPQLRGWAYNKLIQLAYLFTTRKYEPHTKVLARGDTTKEIFVVKEGECRLLMTDEDLEQAASASASASGSGGHERAGASSDAAPAAPVAALAGTRNGRIRRLKLLPDVADPRVAATAGRRGMGASAGGGAAGVGHARTKGSGSAVAAGQPDVLTLESAPVRVVEPRTLDSPAAGRVMLPSIGSGHVAQGLSAAKALGGAATTPLTAAKALSAPPGAAVARRHMLSQPGGGGGSHSTAEAPHARAASQSQAADGGRSVLRSLRRRGDPGTADVDKSGARRAVYAPGMAALDGALAAGFRYDLGAKTGAAGGGRRPAVPREVAVLGPGEMVGDAAAFANAAASMDVVTTNATTLYVLSRDDLCKMLHPSVVNSLREFALAKEADRAARQRQMRATLAGLGGAIAASVRGDAASALPSAIARVTARHGGRTAAGAHGGGGLDGGGATVAPHLAAWAKKGAARLARADDRRRAAGRHVEGAGGGGGGIGADGLPLEDADDPDRHFVGMMFPGLGVGRSGRLAAARLRAIGANLTQSRGRSRGGARRSNGNSEDASPGAPPGALPRPSTGQSLRDWAEEEWASRQGTADGAAGSVGKSARGRTAGRARGSRLCRGEDAGDQKRAKAPARRKEQVDVCDMQMDMPLRRGGVGSDGRLGRAAGPTRLVCHTERAAGRALPQYTAESTRKLVFEYTRQHIRNLATSSADSFF